MAKVNKVSYVSIGAGFALPFVVDEAVKALAAKANVDGEQLCQRVTDSCKSALGEMHSERQSQKFSPLGKVFKNTISRRVNTLDKEIGISSNPLRMVRWTQQIEMLETEFSGMTVTLPESLQYWIKSTLAVKLPQLGSETPAETPKQ